MKLCIRLARAVALPLALLLAACGEQSGGIPDTLPTATSAPATTPAATATPPPTPTATIAPTPTLTLVGPQWLPTALPKQNTPRPTPTPRAEPPSQPEPTAQPASQFPPPTESDKAASPRFQHQAALLDDGRILISGGFNGVANNNVVVPIPLFDVQIYDPASGLWLWMAPQEEHAIIAMSTTVGLSDGRYMSVGLGAIDGGLIGAASVFDTEAQVWTLMPPLASVRGFPKMTLLQDGRVLVTGGVEFGNPDTLRFDHLKETEIFDPRAEEWQSASDMNEASESQAIIALQDGRVMVVNGGIGGAEIYDPAADSWTLTSDTADGWTPLTPVVVELPDGRVLVAGGWSVSEFDEIDEPEQTAQIYDPAADAWESTEPLNEPRMSHTLTLLPDGRVIAVGGMDVEFQEPRATTEIFDPATNEWLPGPDMAEPRYDHTATLLPEGRLFVFGGITLQEDIGEVYPTDSFEFITAPAGDR